ncbi:MAG: transcriptional regulator [Desulfovibrionaceae bacterium]|nr:transcriptional regulator [Desulfovibrionaceae bacterium]
MSLLNVLHDLAIRAPSGKPARDIAERLGLAYSTMMSQLNDAIETHKFAVENLLPFMEITGSDEPLHYLARVRGGVFIKLPRVSGEGLKSQERRAIRAVKEFGELMAEFEAALEDERITARERRRIVREGYDAIQAVMAFLESLEVAT